MGLKKSTIAITLFRELNREDKGSESSWARFSSEKIRTNVHVLDFLSGLLGGCMVYYRGHILKERQRKRL